MKEKKKSKLMRRIRALIFLLLIVLLLLLLDGRIGLGGKVDGLLSFQDDASSEQTVTKLVIEIRDANIFYQNESVTIAQLTEKLENDSEDQLYVLKDALANYSVFSEVESLLKSLEKVYVIEQ